MKSEGEKLCLRWLELREYYRMVCKRRPQVKADCDSAYTAAWRAWYVYATHQSGLGESYRIT